MIDTKVFDELLAATKKQHDADVKKLKPMKESAFAADAKYRELFAEKERIRQLIQDYESDLESAITPGEFEAALMRERSLAVELRRQEAVAKHLSKEWQTFEKQITNSVLGARRQFGALLSNQVDELRASYIEQFNKIL